MRGKASPKALQDYNVGAVDTLIGDIVPPEELMKTLTDRKIAEQEKVRDQTQREAEGGRKDLQQAKVLAICRRAWSMRNGKFRSTNTKRRRRVQSLEGEAKSKTVNAGDLMRGRRHSTRMPMRWCSRPLAQRRARRSRRLVSPKRM